MGLDTVELVMRVEDAFNITIKDHEAAKVRTAGDLFQIIKFKLGKHQTPVCPTARAFRSLRKELINTGLPREKIRPETKLDEIIPAGSRREMMTRLIAASSLKMPPLYRPLSLVMAISAVVFLLSVSSCLVFPHQLPGAIFLSILAFVILASAANVSTRPWATEVHCATMGDFVRLVASYNFKALSAGNPNNSTDPEVWEILRTIIAEQLGLKRDEIHKHSRFVEDMGAD
jgi:acyl carrier protein